jgi:hypothetical protein
MQISSIRPSPKAADAEHLDQITTDWMNQRTDPRSEETTPVGKNCTYLCNLSRAAATEVDDSD